MKLKRFVFISIGFLVGTLLIVVVSCGLLLHSFGNAMCGSYLFQEVYSPDGGEKVIVFQRDCGATTGFRTHISLVKSDAVLGNGTGNIFQADGHPDTFAITVTWEDDTHIVIEHNGKPIPDVARNVFGNKEIRYVENREGIMPPRPFRPSELLLPVRYFPQGWRGEEWRPLGPETVRGSKESNPYMLYDPPAPANDAGASHHVHRLDNPAEAIAIFQREWEVFQNDYSPGCRATGASQGNESSFQSEYTENLAVGFTEHQWGTLGNSWCKMLAQYNEFFIQFEASVSADGLTYDQFNELVGIIDEIMVQHLHR